MKVLTCLLLINVNWLLSTSRMSENQGFLPSLLDDIFGKHYLCLCYLTDNTLYTSETFREILKISEIPFLNIQIRNARKMDKKMICDGYVFDNPSRNISRKVFSREEINFYFKPHRRVLILTGDVKMFNDSHIRSAAALQDLDLFIVEGIDGGPVREWKMVNTKFEPALTLKKFNQTFCVTYFLQPPCVIGNGTHHDGMDLKMIREVTRGWPVEYFYEDKRSVSDNLFVRQVDKMEKNECDVALNAYFLPKILNRSVDKSFDHTVNCITFLVPRPTLLPDATFILQPFQPHLWLIYGLVFLIIWNCLSSDLTEFYQRFLTINLMIFILLTSTFYSAGLTTSLRFPRVSTDINTLQDMINNKLKWLDDTTFVKSLMEISSNPTLIKLAKSFEFYDTMNLPNEKLETGRYALKTIEMGRRALTYLTQAEYLTEYNRRNLKVIDEKIFCLTASYVLKFNSPYTDLINDYMSRLTENGIAKKWFYEIRKRKEFEYMDVLERKQRSELHQNIDFRKIQGAFYILVVGYIVGLMALCCEIFTRRMRRTGTD